ncbi:DNA/RNA helicase domain-containing protein, partial [Leptospira selangorensis]
MIDEQKIVFEETLYLSEEVKKAGKSVLIVEGGPGTGKSVVAINLLVALLNRNLNVRYVSRNAAPRAVFESKLSGTLKRSKISSLFSGSSSFYNAKRDEYDVLLVDEAHRLNQFSGLYGNLGENQVKELIHASRS